MAAKPAHGLQGSPVCRQKGGQGLAAQPVAGIILLAVGGVLPPGDPRLAADILSSDYTTLDTGFADTDAFRWLSAYGADYGFILRWPEDCQAVTGMVYQPWHWRYVGVENARAIAASGLSLEEFVAVHQLS